MKLSQAEIKARLEEVRRSYIASLQDKHDTLVSNWSTLCSQWDPDTYQSLYLILHSLAGAAETFGLMEISRNAQQLVNRLRTHDSQQPLSSHTLPVIENELKQLQAEMQVCVATLKNKPDVQ